MTKTTSRLSWHPIAMYLLSAIISATLISSCNKSNEIKSNSQQPFSYSSEVLDKWMTLQLRLMRNATGIANHALTRHFAYAGIAALESLAPGLPAHSKWSTKWNGLTGIPSASHPAAYYYPANVNAALAYINKAFFPNAANADKMAIDSLETALNESFLATQPASRITSSSDFGKAVAAVIFNWSETDGYKNANGSYTPPSAPGLWKPTPTGFAAPATPYWGANRTIVQGSISNTQPSAPPGYSTEQTSAFYQMVKQVYDASQNLTGDQKAMAMFWRDVPGATTPGHWLSILQQTIHQTQTSLDKAALAYAATGASINDAIISCFITKYQYNLIRPITYIREVMGHTSWNSYIGTPAHPEYSSAHATLSSAAAATLEKLFGNIGTFTDHTYDYLGFLPRTYSSFTAIGNEASKSRLYGGIHYMPTIEASIEQGRKVTANIFTASTLEQ